ncbi:hypothetical protein AB9M10_06055 [Rhodococcus erythropolis]
MSLSKNDASRRPAKVATFSSRSRSPTSSGTVTTWARTPYRSENSRSMRGAWPCGVLILISTRPEVRA